MSMSVTAAHMGITASPVSAASAALLTILAASGVQLADILQPAFGFPDSVISTLLYLFVGGFPVALASAIIEMLSAVTMIRSASRALVLGSR